MGLVYHFGAFICLSLGLLPLCGERIYNQVCEGEGGVYTNTQEPELCVKAVVLAQDNLKTLAKKI